MKGRLLNGSIQMLSSALFSIAALTAANVQAAVSQAPISLTVGVAPNLIFTLDNSGSMRWAFVPDIAGRENKYRITTDWKGNESWVEDGANPNNIRNTRRGKSHYTNPMYYNPTIAYIAPFKISNDGEIGQYETSFTAAHQNGFYPERKDTVNLSSNYRVSWNYETDSKQNYSYDSATTYGAPTGKIFNLAENPAADFGGWPSRTRSGVHAYYYTLKETAACQAEHKIKTDDACYEQKQPVTTAEKQNFAVWYSFYRTRALATISAANLAFSELTPSTRLTWQSLGTCKELNGGDNCNSNYLKEYSASQKKNFIEWLRMVKFDQSTPLREALDRAGKFLQKDIAWQKYPNETDPQKIKQNVAENVYACRPGYHVLMTDGMWNGNNGSPTGTFNHDNRTITLPDGEVYTNSIRPYADSTSNTLADLAMHYWATDLRPGEDGKANKLKPYMPFKHDGDEEAAYWDPRNNPATWQHMVNFTMGLGLTQAMTDPKLPWEGNTFSGTGYTNLMSGTKWPAASDSSDNNVYDLWHAALNSRGEFFSVDSPDAMVQAFADILTRIAERKSSASRPAISSGIVVGDTINSVSYQTSYASDEAWSGDLKRFSKKYIENDEGEFELVHSQDWSAQDRLPSASARTIKIANPNGASASKLMDFNADNAGNPATNGTLANMLNRNPEVKDDPSDKRWTERLNYLRGDQREEGSGETDFRERISVLGDMYGSSPVVVAGPRYLEGFANRLEGHLKDDGTVAPGDGSYSAFVKKINGTEEGTTKRKSRVYVGGNDGMLHGFNAETGAEEFAFIPTEVFPKLHKLTGKNYSHEFYVDGSPTVADIYDGTNSKWRTILVGTLRAGGKSLFALDVTTPGSEELLWEFDASDVDENGVKPGFSFSKPTIARLHDGKWAVVTGNGYENGATDGKAALYIIDAVTGDLTKSLEVTGDNGTNGLSSPVLADYNADGIADYAYAGDLQGNLWRFDLLPTNNSDDDGDGYADDQAPLASTTLGTVTSENFKVGYGGKPMFQAKAGDGKNDAAQPITAAPTLIRHPSRIGNLVVFGTGKFFETEDKEGVKTHAQSVYGIWDTKTRAEPTSENTVKRDQLVKQDIEEEVTGTYTQGGTNPARIISNNPVKWTAMDGNGVVSVNQYGWYLDLAVAGSNFEGEMVIEKISTLGQTLFFQSLVPNDDPCADGASNWTYALNPFTGGKTLFHAFDLRQVSDTGDVSVVSGIKQDGEGGITITQNPDGSYNACTGLVCEEIFPDPASIGRQTWRIVGGN